MRDRACVVLATVLLTTVWCVAGLAGNYYDGCRYEPTDTVGGVQGVRVHISTPPTPDLNGGDVSCAWGMACDDSGAYYAQAGIDCSTQSQGYLVIFSEAVEDGGTTDYYNSWLTPSGTNEYKCNWSGTRWGFHLNGAASPFHYTDNCTWTPVEVEFYGETVPDTTVQLMGDTAHRVTFSQLQWRRQSTEWRSAWPPDANFRNDGGGDWGQIINHTSSTFTIWDTTIP